MSKGTIPRLPLKAYERLAKDSINAAGRRRYAANPKYQYAFSKAYAQKTYESIWTYMGAVTCPKCLERGYLHRHQNFNKKLKTWTKPQFDVAHQRWQDGKIVRYRTCAGIPDPDKNVYED